MNFQSESVLKWMKHHVSFSHADFSREKLQAMINVAPEIWHAYL